MQRRNDTGNESAGILYTDCTGMEARQPQPQQQAQAQAQAAPRRREVVVGGRRVKTIDVHAHCVVPRALELMGRPTSANQSRGPGISEVGLRRIGEMDAQGIDVEAHQHQPVLVPGGTRPRRRSDHGQQRNAAELCATHPDRFVGFASVALQFPETRRRSSSSTPLRSSACAAWRSAPASQETSSPIRSFTRSGPSARSSASWSSFIRRARRTCERASRATAGSPTPSAIRSTPRSRCRTSSSKARSTAFRA